MLETHSMISSLIFCLVLTLMLHLAHLLVLFLVSFMDLTTAHMVLVHKRTVLCPDALVTAHVLIVVIVSSVGMVSCWRVLHPLCAQTLGQSIFSPSCFSTHGFKR
jgi:hypothetical protein